MTAKKARAPRKPKTARTLTQELAALLTKTLIPDLLERAADPAVRAALAQRHATERKASRTAQHLDGWIRETIEQIAAAWALSCVFVRTLEDRNLLAEARLAGPHAKDSEERFFRLFPSLTSRDYLLTVFREIASLPSAEMLLGPRHNPIWRLSPSEAGAKALLDFFRETGEDGALRWRFDGTDTRFLGDLYQDLSEEVRDRFALLQTPQFIESFILDLTLDPAIAEFGLETVKLLDPTCGSGHFLLGAYDRLFERRIAAKPGVPHRQHALEALAQVAGVDLNPYAVAVTRFRLTLSFLARADIDKLSASPPLPLNLVVADSLLHGARNVHRELTESVLGAHSWRGETFDLEDPPEARRIFSAKYHAIVGNPPYITCKDAALRELYRERFASASGKFALSAPFLEFFFQAPVEGGFVGLINANSFMKREFGKTLVEQVLPRVDLTRVIDSSGAFIPGHGTPTVILTGRNRVPGGAEVLTVMGKRGEPATPDVPENGLVWTSIAHHHAEVGYEDEFISVDGVPRKTFNSHPWSLGGGGAAGLRESLEGRTQDRLGSRVTSVGIASVTGEDDLYLLPPATAKNAGLEHVRRMVLGEEVRDWSIAPGDVTVFPYEPDSLKLIDLRAIPNTLKWLWPARAAISRRKRFGVPMLERGLTWYELQELYSDKLRTPFSITFAEVSTHNHFALDRGGRVFKQTAPIMKLPDGASEDDHIMLLGYLNSSTACFWMKQVFMNKAGSGIGRGVQDEEWESRFQFDGSKLARMPIPELSDDIRRIAAQLDSLARSESVGDLPSFRVEGLSLVEGLLARQQIATATRARMVALQEEIDWIIYEAFGLLTKDEAEALRKARGEALPDFPRLIDTTPAVVHRHGLHAGHRPFEIVLSRSNATTSWLERNDYERPNSADYAPAFQRLIDLRVQIIESNANIRLIERPEFKRRWSPLRFQERVRAKVVASLLESVESVVRSSDKPLSMNAVILEVSRKPENAEWLEWLSPGSHHEATLQELVEAEQVPFADDRVYSIDGMTKRAAWKATWELQRRQDAGEKIDAPVPPKFDAKDFRKGTYWSLRGKLDVPKERFISYPIEGATWIGWAGWNHLQRAQALSSLFQAQKQEHGLDRARLAPLLAGLHELVPWLKQWHNDSDSDGNRMGDAYEAFVDEEARKLGLSRETLMTPEAGAVVASPEKRVAAKSAAKAARKKKEASG